MRKWTIFEPKNRHLKVKCLACFFSCSQLENKKTFTKCNQVFTNVTNML